MFKLPQDLKNMIYNDYVKPDMILLELKNILNSNESKKLNHKQINYYLKNVVLKNKIVINHLINNDKIFEIIYSNHIIKGDKTFDKIDDPIESMALTWLMYLYH